MQRDDRELLPVLLPKSTKGYTKNDVTPCFIWRARRDSNSRPLGS